ncbi:MAG: hypothetical protein R3217_06280 [Gammaproteobacteria bacterium]|nr:hypothetical protein [Gammaproteobacteria bacterium]
MITLVSDAFPPLPDEDEIVNPGLFGKRLADMLASELVKREYVVENVFPEDWGWCLELKNDRYRLYVGCGNFDEKNSENRFRVFTIPEKPLIWRWFRKIDTRPVIQPLRSALKDILESHPEIRDVGELTT